MSPALHPKQENTSASSLASLWDTFPAALPQKRKLNRAPPERTQRPGRPPPPCQLPAASPVPNSGQVQKAGNYKLFGGRGRGRWEEGYEFYPVTVIRCKDTRKFVFLLEIKLRRTLSTRQLVFSTPPSCRREHSDLGRVWHCSDRIRQTRFSAGRGVPCHRPIRSGGPAHQALEVVVVTCHVFIIHIWRVFNRDPDAVGVASRYRVSFSSAFFFPALTRLGRSLPPPPPQI